MGGILVDTKKGEITCYYPKHDCLNLFSMQKKMKKDLSDLRKIQMIFNKREIIDERTVKATFKMLQNN